MCLPNYFLAAQSCDAFACFVGTIHDLGLAQTLSGVKSGEITSLEATLQSLDVVECTWTAVIR